MERRLVGERASQMGVAEDLDDQQELRKEVDHSLQVR